MRIALAASEVYPYARTGGLADVLGSLPAALERSGHEVAVFIPFYRSLNGITRVEWLPPARTEHGEDFGIAMVPLPGSACPVYLISKAIYFDRNGLYGPENDTAYPDNAARFSFFCRAVAAAVKHIGFDPEVLHCHDWHAGLIPAYLRESDTATVFTIHNLAFQGCFPSEQYSLTGLPWSLFTTDGLEYWGDFSFLKAGVVYADQITTVSPAYSREIQTREMGNGMDGVLRNRSDLLTGILNGLDYSLWNPQTDSAIAENFTRGAIAGKRACRKDLCRLFELDHLNRGPIIGMVTRLTPQKGVDLLFPIAGRIVKMGVSLAILGTGDSGVEKSLRKLATRFPGRISVILRYDDRISRKIFAGSDIYLMPSRFEPCGLAQMMAMRYGSVPVVRRIGGLTDTVSEADAGGTGFLFDEAEPMALLEVVERAVGAFKDRRRWAWTRKRSMSCNNSWSARVGSYEEVYTRAVKARRGK